MGVARRKTTGRAAPIFRVAEWPMAHFAQIEWLHQKNASRLLAPYGLHHREWRILAFLSEHGATSINLVAENTAIERSTMSKMIDRLVVKRWVERVASTTDARSNLVMLAAQGNTVLAATIPLVQGLFESYRRGIPAADHAKLMQLLRAYRKQVAGAGEAGIGLD